ncbi:aryl-sulfate sulfotransferase [Maribacter ulvicola]|uniref:Arylsulfotransferase (ASST) n=1 Tax=Maribacter ulvicola TaxID=228959 RepID=A0A1N6WW66_9FLAO|nr:aryl-sulfate sulfotransferase [Maribacter ulvicola]SIQ94359.1 Arylsulfotransferase (ASST) [Maribacter ulvicola]
MKRIFYIIYLSLLFWALSCSSDDVFSNGAQDEVEQVVIDEEDETVPNIPDEIIYPIIGETGQILNHNRNLSKEGYVLINEATDDRVYLMQKDSAVIVHEWQLEFGLGNDVELLPDGRLLASLGVEKPSFSFGGFGGIIQIINPDSSIDWEYTLASKEHLIHHDVEMLPNGNVLAIVWDLRTRDQLDEIGYLGKQEKIYTESIIEIDPNSSEIVWKWDSWDHIVQNVDASKVKYGSINENPQLININYVDMLRNDENPDGDIMHANGLDYDEDNDLIYLSVNNYSEIWVLDHSTTASESATSSGGNYGKGGDLVYRFGNPKTYNNEGDRLFYNVHFPNILDEEVPGKGNILVFGNGNGDSQQSVVYEFMIPDQFNLQSNMDNELDVVWEYTRDGLYAPRVSGAIRLDDGNTLITSGTFGVIEVTNNKQVVWEFQGNGFYWRAYHYNYDATAILFLTK